MMDGLKELQKWVQTLSKSEKRAVSLLGKARAGAAASQQLLLFEWLNTADLSSDPPKDAAVLRNLPTVAMRLRELILDALLLSRKNAHVDAQLDTSLAYASRLTDKKLYAAAQKWLHLAKRQAMTACRYLHALQCVAAESKLLRLQTGEDIGVQLAALREEEEALMLRLHTFQDLQHRYDLLRAKSKNMMAPRRTADLEEVHALAMGTWIDGLMTDGEYVERAMATNIKGIACLFKRDSAQALHLYQGVLQAWHSHPEWQMDQGPLLYNMSIMYLIACLTSPLPFADIQRHLKWMPDFKVFSPEDALDFQSTLYLNKFALALNQGKLDFLATLIPETDAWLHQHAARLAPRLVLAYLHNLAVSAFIEGQFAVAKRYVVRILQLPNPKAREDIREFALVLQGVLLYELEEDGLNEYLTRSGKRYFKNNRRELEFELAVFQFLEKALRLNSPAAIHEALLQLGMELDRLAELLPGTVPLLGLMEMRLWVQAKQSQRALREVFLEAVEENLKSLT